MNLLYKCFYKLSKKAYLWDLSGLRIQIVYINIIGLVIVFVRNSVIVVIYIYEN